MGEWIKCKLSDLGEVVGGATPSTKDASNYGGNIAWITPKDLSVLKGRFISHGERNITEKGLKSCSAQMMPKNSVLFSSRAPIGYVAIAQNPVCTNQGFKSIVPNSKTDEMFLYYLLKYNKDAIEAMGSGTTFKEVSGSTMKNIEVIVPVDKSEQEKIASVLSAIDSKIETNDQINDNLQQQAQALFAERFCLPNGDPIPEEWTLVSLGDVAVISNKSFNPLKQPETMLEHYSIPAFDETRYPVFELSSEIKSNKFIVDSDSFMISKLNPITKRVWRPYCMTENAVCSTEFIVYKAKDQELTEFLYSLIDSASFSDFMCSHVTGSTGSRQRTTPSDTLQYQFYMPTADEIADFSAVVAPMYEQLRINAMENARLKGLRDSLLPRLMSGEIDVSDVQI